MQKKQQKHLVSLPSLTLNKDKSKILSRRYQKQTENSITTLQEALQRDKYLVKLHKWRQQGKIFKLQETYDQNCRIFVSLNKQKSHYLINKKKTPSKKQAYLKLTPLAEKTHNKDSYTVEIGTGRKIIQVDQVEEWQK